MLDQDEKAYVLMQWHNAFIGLGVLSDDSVSTTIMAQRAFFNTPVSYTITPISEVKTEITYEYMGVTVTFYVEVVTEDNTKKIRTPFNEAVVVPEDVELANVLAPITGIVAINDGDDITTSRLVDMFESMIQGAWQHLNN